MQERISPLLCVVLSLSLVIWPGNCSPQGACTSITFDVIASQDSFRIDQVDTFSNSSDYDDYVDEFGSDLFRCPWSLSSSGCVTGGPGVGPTCIL